jgi:hypothetical protein
MAAGAVYVTTLTLKLNTMVPENMLFRKNKQSRTPVHIKQGLKGTDA